MGQVGLRISSRRLWCAPSTNTRERKRMVRLLIEDITLNRGDHIRADIRFRGGSVQSITLPRRGVAISSPCETAGHSALAFLSRATRITPARRLVHARRSGRSRCRSGRSRCRSGCPRWTDLAVHDGPFSAGLSRRTIRPANRVVTAAPIRAKPAERARRSTSVPPPEDVGSQALLSVLLLQGLPPEGRGELEDAASGPGLQEAEQVSEVGPGLDAVELAAGRVRVRGVGRADGAAHRVPRGHGARRPSGWSVSRPAGCRSAPG